MRIIVLILISLALTIAGGATAPIGQNSPFPAAKPESVGLSSAAVNAVAQRAKELIDDQTAVGGELLIIKDRKVVLHEVYGLKDLDDHLPMQKDTIFCIRSMTKPIVGVAVQMLIDEGKLATSDKASKVLPSFDNDKSRDITIDQLLTHTAGFPLTLMNRGLDGYKNQREVADQAGQIGPSKKPGFSYSDSDTETLTAIVSALAGEPAEQFIQHRILDPLGMKDTYCLLGKNAPERSRVSSNHAGSTALWHKYWDKNDKPFFPYFLGAAAAYSTCADYARFLAMFMDHGKVAGKQLISEAAVERVLAPRVQMLAPGSDQPFPNNLTGLKAFYGQHMMVFDDGKPRASGVLPVFGHSGSDGTWAWAFPQQNLIALYYTQSRNGTSGFDIESVLGPLAGLPPGPAMGTRLPLDKIRKYVGCYTTGNAPDYFVVTQGTRLAIIFPGQALVALRWPDSQGRWQLEGAPHVQVQFVDGKDDGPPALKFIEDGGETIAKRVEQPANTPSVDQLVDGYRQKSGGAHIDALNSIQLTGTIEGAGGKGTISVIAAGLDQFKQEITFTVGGAKTLQNIVVDRGKVWQQNGPGPFEPLSGIMREARLAEGPIARLSDWRRISNSVHILGKARFGNEDAWIVSLSAELLPDVFRFINADTGLLMREAGWVTVKGVGTLSIVRRYEDYREVGGVEAGVLIPFRIVTDGPLIGHQVVQFKEARANPTLANDAFAIH